MILIQWIGDPPNLIMSKEEKLEFNDFIFEMGGSIYYKINMVLLTASISSALIFQK